ncbi:MAG: tRNA (guanosine(46)-N7)-methyltransferase TrmB [Pseudomonadota bacterium]
MSPVRFQHISAWKRSMVAYPSFLADLKSDEIIVEIGPGRGDFLFHLAKKNPTALIVGIEIKPKRFSKLIKRIEKQELKNVLLIQGDAKDVLPEIFEENRLSQIHILFPDPWPKKRHKKNRLLSSDFVAACIKKLTPNGHIYFTTDFESYAIDSAQSFAEHKELKSSFAPQISEKSPESFETFFFQKWKQMGRKIYYQKYEKVLKFLSA